MATRPPFRLVANNQPVKYDTEQTLEFIRRHFGRHHTPLLTAIVPDGPITTKRFKPGDEASIAAWLSVRQGLQNLYYHPNVVGERDAERQDARARKSEIAVVLALWADGDPRDKDERGETLDRDAERARILAGLRALEPPPTWIIDSGNGYQAGWELEKPYKLTGPADVKRVEAINQALSRSIIGGDKCHEVAHLMRCPARSTRRTRRSASAAGSSARRGWSRRIGSGATRWKTLTPCNARSRPRRRAPERGYGCCRTTSPAENWCCRQGRRRGWRR
jgi:hypothetical protein